MAQSKLQKSETNLSVKRRAKRDSKIMPDETPKSPPALLLMPEDGEVSTRGRVQSIERAFAILEAVAHDRDGITLAELSKRVELHNSTTFHLVRTMVALGYIRQDSQTKRYRIGRPLFALAAHAFDEVEMVGLAMPVLEQLSVKSGESAHFAVRNRATITILARTTGSGPFQIVENPGTIRPANCTALGKVLLAAMRPEMFEEYLRHGDIKRLTEKSITEIAPLRREIEQCRTSGIAYDDGELDPELRCIAAPVRNYVGQVVGAIGISAPIWRLPIQKMADKAEIVRAAAVTLSGEFGYAAVDHGVA